MRALVRVVGWLAILVAAGIALWQGAAGNHSSQPLRLAPQIPIARAPAPRDSSPAFAAGIGFRSHERLVEHYRHHGREFGAISMEEYLARAQALRDRPAGGPVLEARRADGVISRFDRGSGAFLAFDPDGTIRTFFRPTQGEHYFHHQLERTSP